MDFKNTQRKRFVYKAVVNRNKLKQTNHAETFDFPDNLDNEFLTQPSKKLRLNDSLNAQDNILDELMDDDFDFDNAANEINEIEVTASQQVGNDTEIKKTKNIFLNNINKSKLSLRLPKSAASNKNDFDTPSSLLSPLRPPLSKNIQPFTRQKPDYSQQKSDDSRIVPQKSTNTENSFTSSSSDKAKQISQNIQFKKPDQNFEVKKLQEEIDNFKLKLDESEKKFYSKDGEIKILRETLRKQSEEESKSKERILELQNQLASQQSEKEHNLIKEVEKLKTQLQFQSKEIDDMRKKYQQNIQSRKKSMTTQPPVEGFMISPPKPVRKTSPLIKKNFYSRKFASTLSKYSANQDSLLISSINNLTIATDKLLCNHDFGRSCEPSENIYSKILLLNKVSSQGYLYYNKFLNTVCIDLSNCIERVSVLGCSNNEPNSRNLKPENHESKTGCPVCYLDYKYAIHLLFLLAYRCKRDKEFRRYFVKKIFEGKSKRKKIVRETTKMICETNYFYRTENTDILTNSMENVLLSEKNEISRHSNECRIDILRIFQDLLKIPLETSTLHLVFLDVLQALTVAIETAEANSLVQFLQQERLFARYLFPKTPTEIVVKIVGLMIGCLSSDNVYQILCMKNENCPLSFIYTHLFHLSDLSDSNETRQLLSKVVTLLSSILSSRHTKSVEFLLERKCQCSNNLIECLTYVLFEEFQCFEQLVYNQNENVIESNFLDFRQAMTLLATLCINEKSLREKKAGVEAHFTYLLSGAIRMYRNFPSINDAEVMALEDILEGD